MRWNVMYSKSFAIMSKCPFATTSFALSDPYSFFFVMLFGFSITTFTNFLYENAQLYKIRCWNLEILSGRKSVLSGLICVMWKCGWEENILQTCEVISLYICSYVYKPTQVLEKIKPYACGEFKLFYKNVYACVTYKRYELLSV